LVGENTSLNILAMMTSPLAIAEEPTGQRFVPLHQ
jgi:hypothetical protein